LTCIGFVADWRGNTLDAGVLTTRALTLRYFMTFEQFAATTSASLLMLAGISADRFLYAFRLIGALLVATLVPLLIDRRFRR
jgi:hypothetical protein